MVESDAISVPARELGTNVPRAKIFKPTKPLRSNQNKENVDVAVHVTQVASKVETSSDIAAESAMDVSIEANTTIESVDSPRNDVVAATDTTAIIDTASTASSISVADDGLEEELVAMEVDCTLVAQDPSDHHQASGVSEPLGLNSSSDRSPEPIAKGPTPSNSASNKLPPFLSPNEPVFSGKKIYSPLFCFWQVINRIVQNGDIVCIIFHFLLPLFRATVVDWLV